MAFLNTKYSRALSDRHGCVPRSEPADRQMAALDGRGGVRMPEIATMLVAAANPWWGPWKRNIRYHS